MVLIETIENCGCNEVVSDLFKILASKRSTIAETRKLLYALATFKATGTKEALESFETRCPSLLERDFSRVLNWVNGATLPRNAFKDPRNVLSELLEAVKSHDYEKYVSCFPHDLAASFDKPDVEREVFQDKLAVQSISEIMHSLLTDREVQKLKSKKRIRFFTAEHLVELVQEFGEWKIVSFH
ncbi:MAG: hypothetical protein O2857_27600 [Planctomycetota bacterium]|nr:hypothetical protein [Planctomycetota bacterium]